MAKASKWTHLTEQIEGLKEKNPTASPWIIARMILGKKTSKKEVSSLRNYVMTLTVKASTPNEKCSALKEDGTIMTVEEWCEVYGINSSNTKSFKLVTHTGVPYYNIQSHSMGIDVDMLEEKIREAFKDRGPKYKKISRKNISDPHLLVVDPADVHIGKLCSAMETGEDYDQSIAVQRMRDGVKGIIRKASGYNIDKIVLITGNDILHTDSPKASTTAGTFQNTSGMWYENFVNAQLVLIDVIEMLMSVADVEVIYNPSNHDFMSGFMLMQSVKSWFRKCSQVSFKDDMSHRKYTSYGENIISSTHGDGAKSTDLPMLMAHEAPMLWATCKHRYIYTHHVHHKTSKDMMSVCVESLRSPSGTDGWHHRNGYQHAPKAIEGFLHHPKHGQVARLTHIF